MLLGRDHGGFLLSRGASSLNEMNTLPLVRLNAAVLFDSVPCFVIIIAKARDQGVSILIFYDFHKVQCA